MCSGTQPVRVLLELSAHPLNNAVQDLLEVRCRQPEGGEKMSSNAKIRAVSETHDPGNSYPPINFMYCRDR